MQHSDQCAQVPQHALPLLHAWPTYIADLEAFHWSAVLLGTRMHGEEVTLRTCSACERVTKPLPNELGDCCLISWCVQA